jgi:hypothetical protein
VLRIALLTHRHDMTWHKAHASCHVFFHVQTTARTKTLCCILVYIPPELGAHLSLNSLVFVFVDTWLLSCKEQLYVQSDHMWRLHICTCTPILQLCPWHWARCIVRRVKEAHGGRRLSVWAPFAGAGSADGLGRVRGNWHACLPGMHGYRRRHVAQPTPSPARSPCIWSHRHDLHSGKQTSATVLHSSRHCNTSSSRRITSAMDKAFLEQFIATESSPHSPLLEKQPFLSHSLP